MDRYQVNVIVHLFVCVSFSRSLSVISIHFSIKPVESCHRFPVLKFVCLFLIFALLTLPMLILCFCFSYLPCNCGWIDLRSFLFKME